MAVEFTVRVVPKGTETEYMPFFGLEKSEVVFNKRHPGGALYDLIKMTVAYS